MLALGYCGPIRTAHRPTRASPSVDRAVVPPPIASVEVGCCMALVFVHWERDFVEMMGCCAGKAVAADLNSPGASVGSPCNWT